MLDEDIIHLADLVVASTQRDLFYIAWSLTVSIEIKSNSGDIVLLKCLLDSLYRLLVDMRQKSMSDDGSSLSELGKSIVCLGC